MSSSNIKLLISILISALTVWISAFLITHTHILRKIDEREEGLQEYAGSVGCISA